MPAQPLNPAQIMINSATRTACKAQHKEAWSSTGRIGDGQTPMLSTDHEHRSNERGHHSGRVLINARGTDLVGVCTHIDNTATSSIQRHQAYSGIEHTAAS